MQRRHFLVKPENNEYKLREIQPELAESISKFGTSAGQYYAVDAGSWIFYFMNCSISKDHAEKISEELAQDFLNGKQH